MKKLPQRLSLVAQTADVLREQIELGVWNQWLPGERYLCLQLRVSRPTLRAALEVLAREGLFQVAQGQRRRITQNVSTRKPTASKRVALLTPVPPHRLPPFVMFWVDELRERLSEEGFDLAVQVTQAAESARPEKMLDRLVSETPSAVWLLYLSTEPMQRWFATGGVPCVITGSCFSGLRLPSIDLDSRSVCRHAAGVLTAKGHRRIALLLPEAPTAGDQASALGFVEGARATRAGDIHLLVVRHNETIEGVCRKVAGLLAGDHPVTGILVARSVHTLTVLTYLQQRNVKLPKEVALISRDNDPFLDFVVPRITRYACNPAVFAQRVSRLVLQLAREGTVPPRQIFLMPDLIKGETV